MILKEIKCDFKFLESDDPQIDISFLKTQMDLNYFTEIME